VSSNPIPNNKPFKKGQSGNPSGRPKKLPELDVLLTEILGSPDDEKSGAHAILKAMLDKAKRGDVKAADLLLNRAYGKVADKLNIQGNISVSDRPIVFK